MFDAHILAVVGQNLPLYTTFAIISNHGMQDKPSKMVATLQGQSCAENSSKWTCPAHGLQPKNEPKVNPRKLEHGFRMIHGGFPILYFKSMRLMMFQLSGFYCTHCRNPEP